MVGVRRDDDRQPHAVVLQLLDELAGEACLQVEELVREPVGFDEELSGLLLDARRDELERIIDAA